MVRRGGRLSHGRLWVAGAAASSPGAVQPTAGPPSPGPWERGGGAAGPTLPGLPLRPGPGRCVGSRWELCSSVAEVANVTTAVDIYSFGMCALEVSVGHALGVSEDGGRGRHMETKTLAGGRASAHPFATTSCCCWRAGAVDAASVGDGRRSLRAAGGPHRLLPGGAHQAGAWAPLSHNGLSRGCLSIAGAGTQPSGSQQAQARSWELSRKLSTASIGPVWPCISKKMQVQLQS